MNEKLNSVRGKALETRELCCLAYIDGSQCVMFDGQIDGLIDVLMNGGRCLSQSPFAKLPGNHT